MITLQLCSDGMGDNATESDYDDWCEYVADNISDTCGFDVEVEPLRWNEAGLTRVDGYAYDDQREAVMNACVRLWDRWCRASDLYAEAE